MTTVLADFMSLADNEYVLMSSVSTATHCFGMLCVFLLTNINQSINQSINQFYFRLHGP